MGNNSSTNTKEYTTSKERDTRVDLSRYSIDAISQYLYVNNKNVFEALHAIKNSVNKIDSIMRNNIFEKVINIYVCKNDYRLRKEALQVMELICEALSNKFYIIISELKEMVNQNTNDQQKLSSYGETFGKYFSYFSKTLSQLENVLNDNDAKADISKSEKIYFFLVTIARLNHDTGKKASKLLIKLTDY